MRKTWLTLAVAQLLASSPSHGHLIAAEPDLEADAGGSPPEHDQDVEPPIQSLQRATSIRFEGDPSKPATDKTLYVPSPRLRNKGYPLVEIDRESTQTEEDSRTRHNLPAPAVSGRSRGRSLERIASAAFSIGPRARATSRIRTSRERTLLKGMPKLSSPVTIGRNSQFNNVSAEDRDLLGGVEYVALKLLLKLIVGQ